MLILWKLLFSSLFLTNYAFKKHQTLRANYGDIYDDSLDKLDHLEANSLAVLLTLSFVLVLILTCLMFFDLYNTYKDVIALLCLNHIQFFKANCFFILASLLANISFK
jgi:archaellum biogenesis protein FlaJ (TadC family)